MCQAMHGTTYPTVAHVHDSVGGLVNGAKAKGGGDVPEEGHHRGIVQSLLVVELVAISINLTRHA